MYVRSYGRKSRALGDPEEIDVGELVAHQLLACDRWAAQQGVTLAPEERIAEVGSGESLDERPRFAAELRELERHPPGEGLFVVSEVARISRAELEEVGRIIRIFRTAGVHILAAGRRFDLKQPDDEHFLAFQLLNARREVQVFKQRVAMKREQQTRAGLILTGAEPYGYRWERGRGRQRGQLQAIESEIAVVEYLFREALSRSIARLSAETGLPIRKIAYILHNPVYTGYPHRHTESVRTRNGKRSTRLLHQYSVEAEQRGDYPAVVSLEQFRRVEEALSDRFKQRAKTGDADGWCRHLLELQDRPARVHLCSYRPAQVVLPAYCFLCEEEPCRLYYPREPIHAAARDAILAALSSPDALRAALLEEKARRESQERPMERLDLENERERLRSKLADLKLEGAGADSEDRLALSVAEQRVKSQIQRLTASLQVVPTAAASAAFARSLSGWLETAPRYAARFWDEETTTEERAGVAEELLERIVVRIEPRPAPASSLREIVSVEYADWFQPFASHES